MVVRKIKTRVLDAGGLTFQRLWRLYDCKRIGSNLNLRLLNCGVRLNSRCFFFFWFHWYENHTLRMVATLKERGNQPQRRFKFTNEHCGKKILLVFMWKTNIFQFSLTLHVGKNSFLQIKIETTMIPTASSTN